MPLGYGKHGGRRHRQILLDQGHPDGDRLGEPASAGHRAFDADAGVEQSTLGVSGFTRTVTGRPEQWLVVRHEPPGHGHAHPSVEPPRLLEPLVVDRSGLIE